MVYFVLARVTRDAATPVHALTEISVVVADQPKPQDARNDALFRADGLSRWLALDGVTDTVLKKKEKSKEKGKCEA